MPNENPIRPDADPAVAATQQDERRQWGRHTVSAIAQVVDVRSGMRLNTRASDLSMGGCYIDSMTPLPVGTEIRVRLLRDKKVIEVNGTVTYSHAGLGMGVSFSEASAEDRAEIEDWITEISQKRPAPATLESMSGETGTSPDRQLILKLIHLLIAKGVLGEDDARDILNKPLI